MGAQNYKCNLKPQTRKAAKIKNDKKKKMPASMSIVHHKTNLIYKHLVEAVWEEDAKKIWAHRRW